MITNNRRIIEFLDLKYLILPVLLLVFGLGRHNYTGESCIVRKQALIRWPEMALLC
jgi:hypothetical protein